MVSDEGPGDILVNALKFSVSNIASLAIWGIAFVVAIIAMMVLMLGGILIFYNNPPVMLAMMLLSYLPALALGVLLVGFMCQCMKTVIDGGNVMPTGLESPGGLVKDGILSTIISLEAFVVEMIFFVPGILLMFLADHNDSALLLIGLLLMLLAIPVMMVIGILIMIQWAVYADTGSLLRGLNPAKAFRLIASNPGGAVVMLALLIAVYVFFSVVLFLCEILIITILLVPFLAIAMYASVVYIVATFYRQSRGGRAGTVRDATAPGYDVA